MSSDLRQCSREFLSEFIELYKNLPCLWQVKNKDYCDRNKKNIAYEELVTKYKEIDSLANKETVSKKINSMRSVYRKELGKIKKSETSGAGEDDVYKPSLWYYHLLDFLSDQEIPRMPRETTDIYEECASDGMEKGADQDNQISEELSSMLSTPEINSGKQLSPSASAHSFRSSSRKRQALSTNVLIQDVLSRAEKRLESVTADDSFDRYGKHIADRLRQIKGNQIKFVQKLISDVLFEGEMESLNSNWKVIDMGQKKVQSHTYLQEACPSQYEIINFPQCEATRPYQMQSHTPVLQHTGIHHTRLLPPTATSTPLVNYIERFSVENDCE